MMKRYFFFLVVLLMSNNLSAQTTNLLVGTYTNKGNSEGIYTYNYNWLTGDAAQVSVAKNIENPSYLAFSPDRKFVYAVNESGDASTVSAFSYNNGTLTFLNKRNSEGNDPCYLTTDGKNVIVANYSGGTISVFGINADGSLTAAKQVIKHTGKSIDPKGRQKSAHVHMVHFSPDKKFVLVNDLGEDFIYSYSYSPSSSNKVLSIKRVYKTTAGTGPRHLAFSPNGKFVYVVHEFTGVINGYRYSAGSLTKIQSIPTTATGFKGNIDAADIHISADGKFLYETNRGDANTISAFNILPTGIIRKVQTISTLGKGPRNFAIDPSGKHILVAHQYTNDVVIFDRNATTGKLTDSGKRINVGTPVCLLFEGKTIKL